MNSTVMGKKKAKSPCIDICKMDRASGLCKGCLRTKHEIKGWQEFSKSERRVIADLIAHREAAAKAA